MQQTYTCIQTKSRRAFYPFDLLRIIIQTLSFFTMLMSATLSLSQAFPQRIHIAVD